MNNFIVTTVKQVAGKWILMMPKNSPVTALYVVIILFYVFIVLLNHWIVKEVNQIGRINKQILETQPIKSIATDRPADKDRLALSAPLPSAQKSPPLSDINAAAILRTLSTASETYASVNNGNYPGTEESLTEAAPPYMNKSYCGTVIEGFSFTCDFSSRGYTFTGTAVSVGASGTTTFTMKTGGVLTP